MDNERLDQNKRRWSERAGPRNWPQQANRTRQGVPVKSDGQAGFEMGNREAGRVQGRTSRWSASGVIGSRKRSSRDRVGDQDA